MRRNINFMVIGLIITVMFCSMGDVSSQNLVPNGSFEEGIVCPTTSGNVDDECEDWYASLIYSDGLLSSPEWFHECSENSIMSPPNTGFGDLEPFDGVGYAGLVGFKLSTQNGRELIAVELSEDLVIGNSYLVEFEVANFFFPDFIIASNRIGFNFSTHPFYSIDAFPTNSSHYSSMEVIPASGEWQSISQYFLADSAYRYIHIGNFYDDDNTDIIMNSPFPNTSYYAIDNVIVSGVLSNSNSHIASSGVKLFPNPVTNVLNIHLPEQTVINLVRIYDILGSELISIRNNNYSSEIVISVASLKSGTYRIQIVTNKSNHHETFIKT